MKKKICIIYGGESYEHSVSILSTESILKNINKNKYDIYLIYISENGIWYKVKNNKLISIKNIINYLYKFDLVFPVLHGLNGEDGTIQGMLELFKIPYIGCGLFTSSLCMDKVYTKIIFDEYNIKQAKYNYIMINNKYTYVNSNKELYELSLKNIVNKISSDLKYPLFVKPSRCGSSIGVNKAYNKKELIKYIEYASLFDNKVLIEEEIKGKELECGILNKDNKTIVSSVGEIIHNNEFYNYDSKYTNNTNLIIPANIDKVISDKIKELSLKIFKIIGGKNISRIDFFLDKDNNIYLNEINTIPGFTEKSMYPLLFKDIGIKYSKLLDTLLK